jgi:uncharacterized protein YciI
MALFSIRNIDKPNAAELKAPHRDAHIAWVDAQGSALRLAGPLVDSSGASVGSFFLFEAPDLAGAEAINNADPYRGTGAYAVADIHEFRAMRGGLA